MIPLRYRQGTPEGPGVFSCRVHYAEVKPLMQDCFLVWAVNSWYWPISNEKFNGTVFGWVGPLDRRLGG